MGRGKAWGDSSAAGLGGRQSGSGREGGRQAAGEYLGGKGSKEEMREVRRQKTEHLVGLTTERSARPSEGWEEFRGAVWGARQECKPWGPTAASELPLRHRRICDPRQGALPRSLRFRSNEDNHRTSPIASLSGLNELTDLVLTTVPGTW